MTEHWMWAQWTVVALLGLQLLCNAIMDGDPKKGNHSVGITIIDVALMAFLLWAGGFWK